MVSRQERKRNWWIVAIPLALVLAFGAGIAVVVVVAIHSEQRWRIFAAKHHCKVVGRRSGDIAPNVGISVDANGKVASVITTIIEPDETGYLCDDGVTYWR